MRESQCDWPAPDNANVSMKGSATFYFFSEIRYELYFREGHKIPLMGRISNKEIWT